MFRTIVKTPPSKTPFCAGDRVITLGSCFSEMMGRKLSENKFPTVSNPLGILFNPVSLFDIINFSLGKGLPDPAFNCEHDGIHYHFSTHSHIHGRSQDELNRNFQDGLDQLGAALREVKWLFLTFGTSIVYEKDGDIVASCHKQPAERFTRRFLSMEELQKKFTETHNFLLDSNPNLNIVITVSPVRQIKETLELNSVSKSILRLFTHNLTAVKNIQYFPSYEFMTDDLRDYRFYGRDMLHPSDIAEDYIFEKFSEAYFPAALQTLLKKWNKLRQALAHKAFHPESKAHQKFLRKTRERMLELGGSFDLRRELAEIEKQIKV